MVQLFLLGKAVADPLSQLQLLASRSLSGSAVISKNELF